MTTQIPYGPAHAEFPQFAAGHAQYPPAEYHASRAGTGHGAHVGAQAGGHPSPHAGAGGDAPQTTGESYAAPMAYGQPGYGPVPTAPGYSAAPGYNAPPGYGTQPAGTYPPPAAYPTAPPWAPQETPAPQPQAAAPMSPPGVGGLLVPYPEEIQHAPRAQAPSFWPVAVFTFLFSFLGAISAARRAGQARRGRNGVAPYWVTFAVTLVAGGFFWMVGAAAVGVPAYLAIREGAVVKQLEENVVGDGHLAKANVTATDADCRAAGDERVDGTRDYLCQLTLSDGRTGQVMVTADENGDWKPLSR